jgi:GntR family transcriptional repressor for pyruvate dehydrogenase complex
MKNAQAGTVEASRIERVERLRVSDSVAAQLIRLITKKAYEVGEKLPPERVLSEQFGVSRSSMREAIRGMEASGLVSSIHGVGVFVVSNTLEPQLQPYMLVFDDFTVPDLFEVRRTLEGDAAALAARRMRPGEATEMEEILHKCSDPATSDDDFVKLDVRLHQAVAEASKNGMLATLTRSLEPLTLEYSRRVITLPGRREKAHEGHAKIVQAIVARNARNARNAAVAHIRAVEQDILKYGSTARQDQVRQPTGRAPA